MHIKRMHEMIEKLTECTKSALENDQTHVGKYPIDEVVEMIEKLSKAEYYSKISKAMEDAEKEDEAEEKYMLQRMKEEYGEDNGQRYYNDWRYANGRYAPKGMGTRRRNFTEPIIHDTMYPIEVYRDWDRWSGDGMGRMYYAGQGSNSGNSGMSGTSGSGRSMGGQSGNTGGGSNRGYSDGYSDGEHDGNRRGYEDGEREGYERGYSDGERRGRSEGERMGSMNESRLERARRGYEETQRTTDKNTQDGKQSRMKSAENLTNEIENEIKSRLPDMTNEEKTLMKAKIAKWGTLVQ